MNLLTLLIAATLALADTPADKLNLIHGPGKADIGTWAEIAIPEGYVFTGKDGTVSLMKSMGNLTSGEEAGFLAPASVFEKNSSHTWFVVFEFNPTGYVKDDEKDSLDAAKLLAQMQEGNKRSNEERAKEGLPELELTGWAVPPHYDEATHNLEWGLMLKSKSGHNSVNYEVRLLGRSGVMQTTLVLAPADLDSALPAFRTLLKDYAYKSGQKYAEYRQGDQIAKYGLTALIAGGAVAGAAKLGLFKYIWKFLVLGFVAISSFLKRIWDKLFGKKTEVD
jgi:uncharacterized membrane-anchored protein